MKYVTLSFSILGRAAFAVVLCCASSGPGAQRLDTATPDGAYADMQVDAWTLRQRADRGDARSAFLLGTRYASGRGGVRDDSLAVKWFRRAGELGLPEAQYNLALMYATGRGVSRNMADAVRWLRAAANGDYPLAQADLGRLYMTGRGIDRDPLKARGWLAKAAEQGEAKAQYHLGLLHEVEPVVGLDATVAEHWYARAAALGYQPAVERLASLREKMKTQPSAARQPVATVAPRPAKRASPPGKFTIQLANHRSLASARAGVEKLGVGAAARIVKTRSGQRVGFVILYGDYPTRGAAGKAVKALPARVRESGTWIRALSEVRAQRVR